MLICFYPKSTNHSKFYTRMLRAYAYEFASALHKLEQQAFSVANASASPAIAFAILLCLLVQYIR